MLLHLCMTPQACGSTKGTASKGTSSAGAGSSGGGGGASSSGGGGAAARLGVSSNSSLSDLMALPVRDLRTLLTERGGSAAGITEKEELTAKVLEALKR